MITAKEAFELYNQSGAEVRRFLGYTVDQAVQNAAKAGKRSVEILLSAEECWKTLVPTPFERSVIAQLEELGYNVKLERYGEPYVPRGLADDNGNGPMHRNYGFIISW